MGSMLYEPAGARKDVRFVRRFFGPKKGIFNKTLYVTKYAPVFGMWVMRRATGYPSVIFLGTSVPLPLYCVIVIDDEPTSRVLLIMIVFFKVPQSVVYLPLFNKFDKISLLRGVSEFVERKRRKLPVRTDGSASKECMPVPPKPGCIPSPPKAGCGKDPVCRYKHLFLY